MYDFVLCLWWTPLSFGELLPWWISKDVIHKQVDIADNDNDPNWMVRI